MIKDKLSIGLIGLGNRGVALLNGVILLEDDIIIEAVCDIYEDRIQNSAESIREKTGIKPFCTFDYREVLQMDNIDAVIISADWSEHVAIACAAMEAGKIVGCEVGGAYSVNDCWKLVSTYEATGVPIMMLENCCYGRNELMLYNMVKQGVFGEVVHCEGGYHHDLRAEVCEGRENRHYRLNNYLHRNCENYPTHELGPIAKILNINRGNRFLTVSSVASKASGLREFIIANKGADYDLASARFAQGDVVTTTIRCSNGETILLILDTTLPRAYSRGLQIHGTKATYLEDNNSIFIDGVHNSFDFTWNKQWDNVEQYREQYEHPIWREYLKDGVHGDHDGIDYLVLRAFFDSIKYNRKIPIDVYDMASWMCITILSEESISLAGQPLAVPDFTNGRWIKPGDTEDWEFGLNSIYDAVKGTVL